MKIAIPVFNQKLCQHFGHCSEFHLFDVSMAEKKIMNQQVLAAPEHEPGLLPRWLGDLGVNLVIAGGMGVRAKSLFNQRQVQVITGAPGLEPQQIVELFLTNDLVTGENTCDH